MVVGVEQRKGIEVALAVAVETLLRQGETPFEAGLLQTVETTAADAAWAKETQLPHVDLPSTPRSVCLHDTIGWWSIRMCGRPTSSTDYELEPLCDEIRGKAGLCADLDAPSI